MPRHGENIRQRKDGRWEARVIVGKNELNNSVYHSIYGNSYEEVKKKKLEFLQNGMKTVSADNSSFHNIKTFDQLIHQWLQYKKPYVKESTLSHYYFICSHYIIPNLGACPIEALNDDQINRCLTFLQTNGKADHRSGLSPKSIIDIRTIILAVIKYAEHNNMKIHLNGEIIIPTRTKSESKALTFAEQNRLEKYLLLHLNTYTMGILLDLYTGIRIGELCSLKWGNIDFNNWLLYVNKTIQRITLTEHSSADSSKTKLIITEPKTPDSKRVIPIALPLQKILTYFRSDDENYILTGTRRFIEPRSYYARYQRILKKADISLSSFHTLRHTFATRCMEQKIDIKVLSEILGHSEVRTTLQLYVHPSLDDKRDCLNSLAYSSNALKKLNI